MKAAIMQPYFFPYLGYFQLVEQTDRFILFDDVQYIRHGWINRNRILKPGGGPQFIIAPLQKHKQVELIKNISVQENDEWKEKIIRQLDHYRKKAKYYEETIELVRRCLHTQEMNMTKFNARSLELVCEALKIPFRKEISSEMNFDYSNVNDAGEWALRICEQINAKEYINPPGGKDIFDPAKFEKANIAINFLSPVLPVYDQKQNTFEPGLSIIDVLMFNGFAETGRMIRDAKKIV